MDTRQHIQEEKLQNILNPRQANREFKITIRFPFRISFKVSFKFSVNFAFNFT